MPDAHIDERGASAVEYGLLVAGIAALLVAVVFAMGSTIGHLFDDSCDMIAGHASNSNCP